MGSLSEDIKLPTLDGRKWLSGSESDRQEFASDLLTCLKRHGFAKLVNHGISDDAVEDMYRWVSAIVKMMPLDEMLW
jgi:isopenicillin N synthase-like dioxygenase